MLVQRLNLQRLKLIILLVVGLYLVGFNFTTGVKAQEDTVATQLHLMAQRAQEGMAAAAGNDLVTAQREFDELHTAWATFEDQVREQNPTAYVALEGALDGVKDALAAKPADAAAVQQVFDKLMDEANAVAGKFQAGGAAPLATLDSIVTPDQWLTKLELVSTALKQGKLAEAQAGFVEVTTAWPSVEGAIATKSRQTYNAIEGDLGRVSAALKAKPADINTAKAGVANLRTALAPFISAQTYTAFDSAAIILREGLEALLVVAALLAFLSRSGNQDKKGWIWVGAAGGIVVSIITAFGLQLIFSRVVAGQNREMIEGMTGLVAAVMLFYVSYWLHSKASMHEWQKYINTRTSQALARGNLLGLAFLSFLAVFREGAETTIFYLGMAPSIRMSDLMLGLALGGAGLIVMAVLMLVIGVRLPLRLFFRVAGLLVYYLGFKFLGVGIHALQVAGILPLSPIAFLREIPLLGIYPTWETMLPQLLLLAAAIGVLFYLRALDRRLSLGVTTLSKAM